MVSQFQSSKILCNLQHVRLNSNESIRILDLLQCIIYNKLSSHSYQSQPWLYVLYTAELILKHTACKLWIGVDYANIPQFLHDYTIQSNKYLPPIVVEVDLMQTMQSNSPCTIHCLQVMQVWICSISDNLWNQMECDINNIIKTHGSVSCGPRSRRATQVSY